MQPEDFYAKDREPVRPKLKALAMFVAREWERLSVGGEGWRLHQSANGRALVADAEAATYRGAFFVSLRGTDEAVISPGRVNGVMPSIDGVRLDGTKVSTGRDDPGGVPKLSLSEGPGEDGYSHVCLSVRMDASTGEFSTAPDAVSIVHLPELDGRLVAGGSIDDPELGGIHPLAEIEWDAAGRAPLRKRQISYFDQEHAFQSGGDGKAARHVFVPKP